MMSVDETLHYVRAENNVLRHARNAAQQRAEQAERERDEARELLSRIRAITTASLSPLDWTPKTGAEIVGSLTDTPILPTDFDVNAAPTVKVGAARQHRFIEIPGHVHWLFLNWPTVEADGDFLDACSRNYNQWVDQGYTDVKHIPMGDGKLLIEFRKPEVSA